FGNDPVNKIDRWGLEAAPGNGKPSKPKNPKPKNPQPASPQGKGGPKTPNTSLPTNTGNPKGALPDAPNPGTATPIPDPTPSSQEPSFEDALEENAGFTAPGSACDVYVTNVMDSLGSTPEDWPNPDEYKVGENPEGAPTYIDHYEDQMTNTPTQGTNVVMMEDGHPAEHMVVINVDGDQISGSHYSGGQVTPFGPYSQEDFENDFGLYNEFHYLNVD
ncbi:MAG: hypothetical protein MI724_04690, partial [Spirochaetales bacterium]|nr:hypothetical protein [Spirochaetales bacterium]